MIDTSEFVGEIVVNLWNQYIYSLVMTKMTAMQYKPGPVVVVGCGAAVDDTLVVLAVNVFNERQTETISRKQIML